MQKGVYFVLFFLISVLSKAQYVDSGQDPSSINWKQINTANFQIIFPTGFELQANRLANIFDSVYFVASKTLEHQPAKVSILLHNYNSVSNANVLWAPKRSNFYTIPPQDIYVQDWLEQLAIHEFRHVVQIDKMNQGVTKILYYLFGQQGTAAVFGLYIPFWLIEGDAVAVETGLSETGRGRLPSFAMPLRAQVLEKKIFSYDKAYLGSYKNLVADYYTLGYFLSSWARYKYDTDVWAGAFDYIAQHAYNPWSFNKAMKRFSAQGKRGFYKRTLLSLDSAWRIQDASVQPRNYDRVVSNEETKRFFDSYLYPQVFAKNQMLVLKKTFEEIEKLVVIDSTGNEKVLEVTGFLVGQNRISSTPDGNKIVWNEYQWDKRWDNRVYSNIHIYDFLCGKSQKITNKSFLFSSAISTDGKKIVAVEALPNYINSLVVFDVLTGNELQRYSLIGNPFLISPQWDSSAENIVFIQLKENHKIITVLNCQTGNFKEVYNSGSSDISNPAFYKEYVFFSGIWSGIDNIYAIDTLSGRISQITNSRFGAYNVSVDNSHDKLLFNEYTADGIVVSQIDIDTSKWTSTDQVSNYGLNLFKTLDEQEVKLKLDSTYVKSYEIKPYKKYKHLINIHSWGPLALNMDNYSLQPAITILSQNVLSTAFTSIKYAYDPNEKAGGVFADFTYKGWYPELSLVTGFQNRNKLSTSRQQLSWRENSMSLRSAIPLKYNVGPYFYFATPSVTYSYISIKKQPESANINEGKLHSLHIRFSASRNIKKAYLDLRPRWGQTLVTGIRFTPFGDFLYNNQFYTQLGFNFPGIARNHNFAMSLGLQKYFGTDRLRYSDAITPIRGLGQIYDNSLSIVKFNYILPLCYPDLSIPGLIYIKRVYVNLFWDQGFGKNDGAKYTIYKSTGAELMANFHILSHIIPIAGGVRYNYLPQFRNGNTQLILNFEI